MGVYLILASEGVMDGLSWLQHEIFPGTGIIRIGIIMLSAIFFFVFGLLIDLIRQSIFACVFKHAKEPCILKIWDKLTQYKWVASIEDFLHE